MTEPLIIGSVHGKRSMQMIRSQSRRRCHCGCKTRATHLGMGDGVALMNGCEFYVRRWVRDGLKIYRRSRR
jgi:hypothetical protein